MQRIAQAFNELNENGRALIDAHTDWMTLRAGSVLFERGAPGDSMYLVRSGSLGIFAGRSSGNPRLIGIVRPGETVGEMGIISSQPRSATVAAIRDTELLRLAKPGFDFLLENHPNFAAGLIQLLVDRLRVGAGGSEGATYEPRTVAFLPATVDVDVTEAARSAVSAIEASGQRALLIGSEAADWPRAWFDERERDHDFLIFACDQSASKWVRTATRQADRIFIVAHGNTPPRTTLPTGLIEQRAQHQLLDLLFLHKPTTVAPRGTKDWLNVVPANRHFHLRLDRPRDRKRLGRIVSGRTVGFVLSGGGARAYAHFGVMRGLAKAGVPIDYIGGTSMGGIVSACLAMGWNFAESEERIRAAFVASNPLADYTIPAVGLVRGRKVERLLAEHFGQTDIPDLWLPFFCVSSNLTRNEAHVHRRGRLRTALRASISLPGVLPPKVTARGVLVDGGSVNNLPVTTMRRIHRGPIIAVDVARDLGLKPAEFRREMTLPLWRKMFRVPIVSVLIRSATVSSSGRDREEGSAADVLLSPPLGPIEIRDWKAFDEAVEIGERHALEMLETSDVLQALCVD